MRAKAYNFYRYCRHQFCNEHSWGRTKWGSMKDEFEESLAFTFENNKIIIHKEYIFRLMHKKKFTLETSGEDDENCDSPQRIDGIGRKWNKEIRRTNTLIYFPASPVPGCAVHRYRLYGGQKGLYIRHDEVQRPATVCWLHACRRAKIYSHICESSFNILFIWSINF